MMQFTGLSVFTAVESIHLVTSLAVQWLRRCFQCRGHGCRPCLVKELRSFLPGCTAKKKKKTTHTWCAELFPLVRLLVFSRNFHIAFYENFSASSCLSPLGFFFQSRHCSFMWLVGWVCSGVSDQNILSGPSLGGGWECQPSPPHLCPGPGRWSQLTSLFQDPPPQALPWNTPEVASLGRTPQSTMEEASPFGF